VPPPPFIMQPNPDNTSTPSVQWSIIFDSILNEAFGGFDDKISKYEMNIEMDRRRRSVWNKLHELYPNSRIPKPEEFVGIHDDATQEELNFVIDKFVEVSVDKHINDNIEDALKESKRVQRRRQEEINLSLDSFPELK